MKTQINTAVEFVVSYSNGSQEQRFETYAEAVAALKAEGCEVVGHDGDLEGGGDRTLAWRTEADSIDDDGARTYARISGRY